MEHLYDRLAEYAQGPDYPLHMPGHKRRTFGEMPPELYRMDITEIDGFDNLHAPEGILLDLQKRAAALYGAEESFVLVNGSTGGILNAVSAAVPFGGKLLISRGCHKSVYHASYLRRLKLSYIYPEIIPGFEISDALTPEQVREALQRERDADAVLIVSPTYEGRIARVREIAEIVHSFGKILIVDEAHGAHLGLAGNSVTLPENSCQAGADLVIHSLHKTLPAMTQTALLHVSGQRVDRNLLKRFLRIYQSSSPSYVLMASVDNALSMVEREGRKLFTDFYQNFWEMMRDLQACRRLKFLAAQPGRDYGFGNALQQDIGKLAVRDGAGELSGRELYDRLRQQYHLQLEMAAGNYCLAMFTVGDTPEGYRRMAEALLEMDRELGVFENRPQEAGGLHPGMDLELGSFEGGPEAEPVITAAEESVLRMRSVESELTGTGRERAAYIAYLPIKALELYEAWDCPWEEIPLAECEGRIAADFINLYPPGSPILAPGELLTGELCGLLRIYKKQGLNLQGADGPDLLVKCVREGEKTDKTKTGEERWAGSFA